MASSRPLDHKAALAQIVAPQTLLDIEEYIKPQFPPRRREPQQVGMTAELSQQNGNHLRRRIVMDGYGRWREVKPQTYDSCCFTNTASRTQRPAGMSLENEPTSQKDMMENVKLSKTDSGISSIPLERQRFDSRKPRRRNASPEAETVLGNSRTYLYDHLSMVTRSNLFPGLGNNRWDSTTSRTFVEQFPVPPRKRSNFFGIQTDEFGKWSAANVYHERMKKTWNEYLSNTKKPSANWKPPVHDVLQFKPKAEDPQPAPKPKKATPKPKPKKNTPAVEKTPPASQVEEVATHEPEKPPIDLPADDGNDDFWDFYDKPFNKPG